jgi:hypothetical protein
MLARRSCLLLVAALGGALGGAGACGKSKGGDATGAAGSGGGAGANLLVTISGTAAPHPLNHMLGADDDFSMLRVAIVDPSAVILDPNATPLGAMPLDTTTPGNCDPDLDCMWTLAGVDLSNPNLLGLVGTLEDLRTGDARLWVKTGTGMGTMADLAAVRASPMPITGRRAFAVSRKLEVKLGAFAGATLGQSFAPGALEARGFLIGHVVGKLSEGPMPAPLAGATVHASSPRVDIVYPSADFASAGTATSASGIFLMVPQTAEAVVATWDVVPPAGETRTWPTYIAGSNPNNAFVIILPANE